jgi:hypothetical protein
MRQALNGFGTAMKRESGEVVLWLPPLSANKASVGPLRYGHRILQRSGRRRNNQTLVSKLRKAQSSSFLRCRRGSK